MPWHDASHAGESGAAGEGWAAGEAGATASPADRALGLVRRAVRHYGGRIALVSSFGAESAVLLDLVARVAPATPVIFLDTGKLFDETLDYRRALAARLGLSDVRDVRPDPADLAAGDPDGDLHRRDPDRCCRIRKVLPLERALDGFDAWFTGRKRFHGGERRDLAAVEFDGRRTKVNPLADWTPADLDAYVEARRLPAHRLLEFGYLSIGCAPCTAPVAQGADGQADRRAGRWGGSEKSECGIHSGYWNRK